MTQGTPEWHARRCGKVTASRIADLMAKTKSGAAASRANLMAQLVVEVLTGRPTESFQSPAMTRGIELEPMARERYSVKTGHLVDQVDFVDHPTIASSGASPDGLVSDDMVVEFKCPTTSVHFSYIESRRVPSDYNLQIQWQLACTQRVKADFVSFDDRVPEQLQLLIIPVQRDDALIAEIEKEVTKFLQERDEKVKFLREVKL